MFLKGYHDKLHRFELRLATIVSDKKVRYGWKKTAVVSTINGDANVPFYKELGNQGTKAEDISCSFFCR